MASDYHNIHTMAMQCPLEEASFRKILDEAIALLLKAAPAELEPAAKDDAPARLADLFHPQMPNGGKCSKRVTCNDIEKKAAGDNGSGSSAGISFGGAYRGSGRTGAAFIQSVSPSEEPTAVPAEYEKVSDENTHADVRQAEAPQAEAHYTPPEQLSRLPLPSIPLHPGPPVGLPPPEEPPSPDPLPTKPGPPRPLPPAGHLSPDDATDGPPAPYPCLTAGLLSPVPMGPSARSATVGTSGANFAPFFCPQSARR